MSSTPEPSRLHAVAEALISLSDNYDTATPEDWGALVDRAREAVSRVDADGHTPPAEERGEVTADIADLQQFTGGALAIALDTICVQMRRMGWSAGALSRPSEIAAAVVQQLAQDTPPEDTGE